MDMNMIVLRADEFETPDWKDIAKDVDIGGITRPDFGFPDAKTLGRDDFTDPTGTFKRFGRAGKGFPTDLTFDTLGVPSRPSLDNLILPTKLSLDVVSTSAGDRRDLRHEKGVLAAAPPMPIVLIRSVASAGPGGPPTDGPPPVSWGIEAVNALGEEFTGKGVTVAVLDTGIDANHPAFAGVELVCENFTTEPDEDIDGHGTHCAGTVFGRDVDGHRIGVARGVTKALIGKVIGEGGGSSAAIARAIHWAQGEGAQVISMSIGLDFITYQKQLMEKYGLKQAHATSLALAGYRDNVRLFDRLSSAISTSGSFLNSAVVAAAAGNESHRPDYSITVAPPAAAEFFVSVCAVAPGKDGAPYETAPFSNDGARFAAPGVHIWSAKKGGGLKLDSGTSMATPHVAGVAARWAEKLMQEEKFRADRVIDMLELSARKLAPHVPVSDARHGMVQGP